MAIIDVFVVPGESIVHILDSLGKSDLVNYHIHDTERSASIAAASYAKRSGRMCALIISSGSCGPNALQGVANAWIDSTPLVVISGQARSDQNSNGWVRQLGNKSLNIVDMVRPITKYAVNVNDLCTIGQVLRRAIYMAADGRGGPVWIDIPIDIQGEVADVTKFSQFNSPLGSQKSSFILEENLEQFRKLIISAERPVVVVGNGVRLADAVRELREFLVMTGIPVISTRKGADILPDDFPLYFGRSGVFGQRRSNFIVQNADLVIGLGARFSIPQIGREPKAYARGAKIIMVDIDQSELDKETLSVSLKINADLKFLLPLLNSRLRDLYFEIDKWTNQCRHWSVLFHPMNENYAKGKNINLYIFIRSLSEAMQEGEQVCVDGGSLMNAVMQVFKFKEAQRMIGSTGIELPGMALATAIGAATATQAPVVCLTELQSFISTSHELLPIVENSLPIKIFVVKNNKFSTIRKIQEDHFNHRYVGTDLGENINTPNLEVLCNAYNLKFVRIDSSADILADINGCMDSVAPLVCEVVVNLDQELIPRVGFKNKHEGKWLPRPLEDMYPFLDVDVLRREMIVPCLEI